MPWSLASHERKRICNKCLRYRRHNVIDGTKNDGSSSLSDPVPHTYFCCCFRKRWTRREIQN
jgi:hypothetical protein